MAELGIRLLILTQLSDYMTFVIMVSRHGLGAEANPVVMMLAQDHGIFLLTAAKVAAVVLVATTFMVVGRSRPRLAAAVLLFGVISGGIGAFTNLATI
jgi:hypothetical protein